MNGRWWYPSLTLHVRYYVHVYAFLFILDIIMGYHHRRFTLLLVPLLYTRSMSRFPLSAQFAYPCCYIVMTITHFRLSPPNSRSPIILHILILVFDSLTPTQCHAHSRSHTPSTLRFLDHLWFPTFTDSFPLSVILVPNRYFPFKGRCYGIARSF